MSEPDRDDMFDKLQDHVRGLNRVPSMNPLLMETAAIATPKPDGIPVMLREAVAGSRDKWVEIRVLSIPDIGQVIAVPNSFWRVAMVTHGRTRYASEQLVDGELLLPTVWVTRIDDAEVPAFLKESAEELAPHPQADRPPHS